MQLRLAGFLVALAVASASGTAWADAESCAEDGEAAADARDAGHYRDARTRYERCAVEACPRIVRDDCRAGIAWLRSDAPSLVVRVRSAAGADVAAAHITIDGVVLPAEDAAAGVLVDLGTHVVGASAPGYAPREESVVVGKVDHARAVELVLASSGGKVAGPLAPTTVVERDRTGAFVAFGVGAAALAVFGVVGTVSLVAYEDLKSSCPRCEQSAIDRAHAQAIAADVALGIGVAAVAVGVVLWFVAPARTRTVATLPLGFRF